ncbi:MAG: hypothetical protein QMD09_02745 [Desulfatibacillaceae bacterium]|nr:hypothetical protein [Desulfatibacillaceae bacterium]
MGRRDQWKQVQSGIYDPSLKARTVEERETVPDIACGLCKNFAENAYASDGRGLCRVLKIGSDISASPVVYVLEGEVGYPAYFTTNAASCTHFERMDFIDTDGSEVADPNYRRVQRQMENKFK